MTVFDGRDTGRSSLAIEVSVADAIRLVRTAAPSPRRKIIALHKAHGRVLADAVTARRDQPPFDASAMDGYAVSTLSAAGNTLTTIGESQAGRAFEGEVAAGQAVCIYTGAPVPAGATCVVLKEDTVRTGDTVTVQTSSSGKPHIRLQGGDFRNGDVLLQPGTRLDAWRLSLAAVAGAAKVCVARKPRVAIVCTGDELVEVGNTPRRDQIFESNSFALKALVRDWGGKTMIVRIGDDRKGLTQALQGVDADLIVTVGGASVGDYDLVKPVLSAMGIRWAFGKVTIKPGRPTAFGQLPDGRYVLCLPGNPAAALICAGLFLRPFVATMLGQSLPEPLLTLPLANPLPANGPRETFLRARIVCDEHGAASLVPFIDQDSSAIAAFAHTHALIRRPAHAPAIDIQHVVSYFVPST